MADDFFLLTRDAYTGTPLVAPGATQVGLAAALLGELAMAGNITTRDGEVLVVDLRPPADALTHLVLDRLTAAGRPHPIPAWFNHLGPDAVSLVGTRLARAGLVRHRPKRWYCREHWFPLDHVAADWPATRLHTLLRTGGPVTISDATLAGLAVACGLPARTIGAHRARGRSHLADLTSQLPGALRELIVQTEAAVAG